MSELHRLDLRDRGLGHKHRWWPHCQCGGVGVYRRRKKEAVAIYRDHQATAAKGTSGRPSRPARKLTPIEDLPEALR